MTAVFWNCTTDHRWKKHLCVSHFTTLVLTCQLYWWFSVYFRICFALLPILTCHVSRTHQTLYFSIRRSCEVWGGTQVNAAFFSFLFQSGRHTENALGCWFSALLGHLKVIKPKTTVIPNILSDANSNEVMWCNRQKHLWDPSHLLYSKNELLSYSSK